MWKNPIGNKMENILITESVNRKCFFDRINPNRKKTHTHSHAQYYRFARTYVRCANHHVALYLFYSSVANCSFSISHTRRYRRHISPLNLFSLYLLGRIIWFSLSTRTHRILVSHFACVLPELDKIPWRSPANGSFRMCKSAIFPDTCTKTTRCT